MRIYKGSEITLKLYTRINCQSIEADKMRVVLFTTNPNNSYMVNNVVVSGNTLLVTVGRNDLNDMEDGVIYYIILGYENNEEIYNSTRQSNYYLKTPDGYVAKSIQTSKDVYIVDNGEYKILPDEDYSSIEEVNVHVELDTEPYIQQGFELGEETQKSKLESVSITSNGTYTREDGYNQVVVDVPDLNGSYDEGYDSGYTAGEVEQKSKLTNITITENGTYTREDGYNSVEVALPIQTDKVADIRMNGSYVIEPDDNYVALDKVVLNVEAKAKTTIPNGLSFAESTFTEFPVENYDWKSVRDTTYMFGKCPNLNTAPIIDALKDGTIPTLCTPYMFYGDSVKKIEGIDFTKFDYYEGMFYDVKDLDEVRNCVIPPLQNQSLISCTNKLYKAIDCDFSKLSGKSLNISNYYFCNFKNLGNLTELSSGGYSYPVYLMECDKPSTLSYITSAVTIWYDASKYTGWEGRTDSHPYGFWYNVISKNPVDIKITQPESTTKLNFEQVIPYNEEKGCHYINYPYYMDFDVHINGAKIDSLRGKFNIDVYYPSNEVGVYEGLDIKYLFYYTFADEDYALNEDGLFALKKSNAGQKQRFNTPTDTVKITTVRNDSSGSKWLNIIINGVDTRYVIQQNSETEFIIDTSNCEYMDVVMYITSNLDKTYIKSIEIL